MSQNETKTDNSAIPGPVCSASLDHYPIAAINLTGKNPRIINEKSEEFIELVDSIKANGVIVPIHIRELSTDLSEHRQFELLAGERRLLAAIKAGAELIPAINHGPISDQEAFEIMFIENFARQDLTVLEQGKAAVTLLIEFKGDAKAAASKLGRSEKWLRTRAAIENNLIKRVKDYITEHTGDNWTAAHLALVARLPRNLQEKVFRQRIEDKSVESVDDLKEYINEMMRLTSKAPWHLSEKIPVEIGGKKKTIACLSCKKRTSFQPGLFEDDPDDTEKVAANDKCLNENCWQQKMIFWLKIRHAELKKENSKLVAVTTDRTTWQEDEEFKKSFSTVFSKYQFKQVGKNTKGAIPAMIVKGGNLGQLTWIKLDSRIYPSSSGRSSGRPGRQPGKPTLLKQRRKELESKRWQQVLRHMRETVDDGEGLKASSIFGGDAASQVIVITSIFGTEQEYIPTGKDGWDLYDKAAKNTYLQNIEKLWEQVRSVLADRLLYNGPITQVPQRLIDEAKKVARVLKININAMYKEAVKDNPEPKSWKNLKADGTPKLAKKTKKKKAKSKPTSKKTAKKVAKKKTKKKIKKPKAKK